MRVIIFAGLFYPSRGGYETFIYNFAKHLMKDGNSIDILTTNKNNSPHFEIINHINIYRLDCWNILGGTYPIPKPCLKNFRILKTLMVSNYDIVNTHTRFFVTTIIGTIYSIIKDLPLIHIEHGSTHCILENKAIRILSSLYDHVIGGFIVKTSFENIGVSKASCDFMTHLGSNKSICISNGVDLDLFNRNGTRTKDRYCLNDEDIGITCIGRLIYAKGAQDIINIYPRIKEKYSNVKLIIIGDGPYRAKLGNMCKVHRNSIFFLGFLNAIEIVGVLSFTDIFVNLSYSEGFGITILEAGAMGIPIIATDVGATSEIINDNQLGIIIPPGDTDELYKSLIILIENPSLRISYGSNILSRVKSTYDWNIIAKKYEQVFTNCFRNAPNNCKVDRSNK
jgi:glycosyltransferase involved in cell wall biosynthesis